MAQSQIWQHIPPRNYDEKRSFRRMNMDCPISFATTGEHETWEGQCKNLSAQGLLFNTRKLVAVGTLVDVNITLKKAVVEPFNAVVEVVRVSNIGGLNNYEIAARIKQMK
jgi:hypothetical protein